MSHLIQVRFLSNVLWGVFKKKPVTNITNKALLSSVVSNSCHRKCLIISSVYMNQIRCAKKGGGKMSKGGKPKVVRLTDEEMSEVINVESYRNELSLISEKLKKDYIDNLSLRSSSNVESIMVKIEAEEYPLHELAQIARKGQNLIAINMVDFPEALKPAIQAIIDSGIGLNPQQEGTMIYLTIPKISREHRESLAKNAKTLFVKAKEEVKSVQNIFVREAKRKTDLSEDLVFNTSNMLMQIAEQTVSDLEKIMKIKQKELLGET